MGGVLPKQYLPLGGVPLIRHTLETLLGMPEIDGIVVTLSADDSHWPSVFDTLPTNLHTTEGGIERVDSVMAGLEKVLDFAGGDARVLVHDAARPLATSHDIRRLMASVDEARAVGGILAVPVQDTLKRSDDTRRIVSTVRRSELWQAQTPQYFPVTLLYRSLQTSHVQPELITDEASAIERAGHEPLLVEALDANFKITRPGDLALAEAVLASRNRGQGPGDATRFAPNDTAPGKQRGKRTE